MARVTIIVLYGWDASGRVLGNAGSSTCEAGHSKGPLSSYVHVEVLMTNQII